MLALLTFHGDARADEVGPNNARDAKERPWAKDVPSDQQKAALEEFRQGNERFATSDYTRSVEHYRKGLGFWDHPALHGNLAVALIRLKRPLDAFRHVQLALRWDMAPLESHVYEQLVTSQALLQNQLAQVAIVCNDALGAKVTLDGAEFTTCPDNQQKYALAGNHELVARKEGYLTLVERFSATPGKVTLVKISLIPLADTVTYERRFARWKPWAVLGAGAGFALVGVGLSVKSRASVDDYDREIDRLCPNGCPTDDIPQTVSDLESRAALEESVAIGALVVGGAAIVAGLTLLQINQPRRVELDADGRRVSLVPQLAPGHIGIAASLRF
ncbi:MAG: hypothetical protein JKY56_25880 [Kofleriaceae bacterium]|nr:hypothetical protein [Kofleriaceae bacterium]